MSVIDYSDPPCEVEEGAEAVQTYRQHNHQAGGNIATVVIRGG